MNAEKIGKLDENECEEGKEEIQSSKVNLVRRYTRGMAMYVRTRGFRFAPEEDAQGDRGDGEI